jgi:CBS domain-containing protein
VTAISQNVPAADPPLTGLTVQDVMVTAPKTMLPTATVADAREFFADDHFHMALITRRGQLLGTLVRSDLPELGDDAAPALSRSHLDGRSVALHEPAEDVRVQLIRHGQRRLAVVDDAGLLAGLVCLKRKLTGFCSDADVAERDAERQSPAADSIVVFRCMPVAR